MQVENFLNLIQMTKGFTIVAELFIRDAAHLSLRISSIAIPCISSVVTIRRRESWLTEYCKSFWFAFQWLPRGHLEKLARDLKG
jgi:hypothetical protein